MKKPTWASRIDALIEKLGSPEAVAARLGVSFFTVLRWKNGEHEPSPLAQEKIEELEKEEVKK